jgi:hypothetical protein
MGFMGLPNLSGFEGTVELFLQLAVNSVLNNKDLPVFSNPGMSLKG